MAAAQKKTAQKKTPAPAKRHRVFGISFASLYPLYVKKVESKGRTRAELDEVIAWLTGYEGATLERVIAEKDDLERFFDHAPRMNPNAKLVTGVVCGVRVEEVEDPLMRKIRQLDKLVDELAKGKTMASILRRES
ncbi:MAG: DUF2200 domain-containing protein [Deltaproteobacteria bacterium]|nr:DUF2200 domain-containing protein [Deltaproteobacteria bacterium]